MLFTGLSTVLVALLASSSTASPLEKRITVHSGTIASPADGTLVSAGGTYPFQFDMSNWCEAGYTPYDVYILASEPTADSMNATEGFNNYLYHYGTYTVDNFPSGLPPLGTPPPASLTMPDLGAQYAGEDVWLTVVQTERYCPPDGHTEWVLASNSMTYSE